MSDKRNSDMERRNHTLRLSNEESNKITKESIETALLLLMEEKEFKDISITDIVKRSGVSRTAYYRNYSSKEDILNTHLNTVVKATTDEMDFTIYAEYNFKFWYSLFDQLSNYKKIYSVLINAGFEGVILTSINNVLLASHPKQDITSKLKYDIYFWSGAIYNILIEWMRSDMKESIEEMAQICCAIVEEASGKRITD